MQHIILSGEDKAKLDAAFQQFLFKFIDVARTVPKEKYLYPIMRGVPFRDLEVALDLAILDCQRANDNAHE